MNGIIEDLEGLLFYLNGRNDEYAKGWNDCIKDVTKKIRRLKQKYDRRTGSYAYMG